uniref:G_PROTEIN_RECEP_F1_2 domain-containing protein n=1 Tax=Heterorhabditis bacteriophora TaxID=37862 RepID=A0A1I7XRG1_HETBA
MLNTTVMPILTVTAKLAEDPSEKLNYLKAIYEWLIPIMIIILLMAIVGNGVIVLSAPWLSPPVSPYLKLCISLAAADMWAASLLITGGIDLQSFVTIIFTYVFLVYLRNFRIPSLVVNSYIPVVLGHQKTSRCVDAWLEMFRISGMLTSDMHLFALAINQFVGTMWPLKYKIMVTTRRIRYIILSLWLVPLLFVFCWFVAAENDGLRHEKCQFFFYNRFPFRITIFLIFMLPLIATLLIYGLILSNLLKAKAEFETSVNERKAKEFLGNEIVFLFALNL